MMYKLVVGALVIAGSKASGDANNNALDTAREQLQQAQDARAQAVKEHGERMKVIPVDAGELDTEELFYRDCSEGLKKTSEMLSRDTKPTYSDKREYQEWAKKILKKKREFMKDMERPSRSPDKDPSIEKQNLRRLIKLDCIGVVKQKLHNADTHKAIVQMINGAIACDQCDDLTEQELKDYSTFGARQILELNELNFQLSQTLKDVSGGLSPTSIITGWHKTYKRLSEELLQSRVVLMKRLKKRQYSKHPHIRALEEKIFMKLKAIKAISRKVNKKRKHQNLLKEIQEALACDELRQGEINKTNC